MTYPTLQVAVDVPSYTDITAYVCHDTMQISRGRSDPSGDFQPATGTFSLINTDGRFDPSDTSGPYGANFRLRTPVYIYADLNGDTFPLANGWITSIRQRWNHRGEQVAEVAWIDALGLLATYELPESAWDHVIGLRPGKVCWFKLGSDTTSTVRDYSGNEAHGKYVTYEGTVSHYGGGRTPDVIVQEGVSKPLIPQVDRPGQSWGKMIAAADQPFGGSVPLGHNWRATAIVCDQTTATLQEPGAEWTIEAWLTYRQAFSLNPAALRTGGGISTSLYQWGDTAFWTGTDLPGPPGPMMRVGWYLDGDGLVSYYTTAFPGLEGLLLGSEPLSYVDDINAPMHLVVQRDGDDINWYVNGQAAGSIDVSAVPLPRGFPLAIAASSGFNYNESYGYGLVGFFGEIGDVVVYNRAISGAEITASYVAGRWGRTDSTAGPLLPGEAFQQASDIASGEFFYADDVPIGDGSHYVVPGPFARRNALDYMRLLARSENGQLYATAESVVTFLPSAWQLSAPSSSAVQWIITDDDIADPGGGTWGAGDIVTGHTGGALSVDDGGLINDVTVTWRGGTVPYSNSTSVGTFGRLRRSIDTALSDVRDAKSRAEWEVWRYGSVVSKISSITVEPADETSWYAALSLDLLHRVRVILTRPDGSQFDQECFVESISHSIDMGQGAWRTTLGLSAADLPAAPFVIDSSEIAGPDVVWY